MHGNKVCINYKDDNLNKGCYKSCNIFFSHLIAHQTYGNRFIMTMFLGIPIWVAEIL